MVNSSRGRKQIQPFGLQNYLWGTEGLMKLHFAGTNLQEMTYFKIWSCN
jgi:hypothetical protein